MKTPVLFLIAVTAAIPVLATPPDRAADAARRELTARYAGISRAFASKDSAGLSEPLAADYSLKQPDGRVLTRDAIAAMMTQQMKMMSHPKWVRTIESLTLKGPLAVATVRGVVDAGTTMQGKTHQFHMNALTKDTWSKQGRKWMLKSSQVIENHVEMDGKPLGTPTR
jgi:hypothetical protein